MGQYEWRNYRAATMMRGSLIPLIYQKSLLLDSSASSSFSPTAALTLVSTDIETITSGLVQVHETWSSLLEIGIAIYLLERQLGAACVMGVGFALGTSHERLIIRSQCATLWRLTDCRVQTAVMIGTVFLAKPTGTHQAAWIQASQIRVSATSKALGSIKWLKISGLSNTAFSVIRNLRVRELAVSTKFRLLLGVSLILCAYISVFLFSSAAMNTPCWLIKWSAEYWPGVSLTNSETAICTPILGPLLTFATFAGIALHSNSTLTIAKVFTSFSIIVLLNSPLAKIVIALPQIAGAAASFQRIQDHLTAKERNDTRVGPDKESSSRDGPDAPFSVILSEHSSAEEINPSETAEAKSESLATTVSEPDIIASLCGKFFWQNEKHRAVEGGNDASTDGAQEVEQGSAVTPVIEIVPRLDIPRRALTLVLGPVGCGKSTLLKAFLGELSGFDGTIRTQFSGAVTYCDQNPWLPNETVRDVICGSLASDTSQREKSARDDEWYRAVIRACELERDMQIWPRGDETPVGSKGISMSGGQKQRLCLARAIFARRELLLLDDVFSGLDANTEDVVFDNLLGPDGLVRKANMTAIVVTSDGECGSNCLPSHERRFSGSMAHKLTQDALVHRVPYADRVVVLNEHGQLRFVGSPTDLKQATDLDWALGEAQTRSGERKAKDASGSQLEVGGDGAKAGEPQANTSTETEAAVHVVMQLVETEADSTRQMGDSAVYKFYAKSAGWFTITTFVVSICIFAFCDSFPSK